MPALDFEGLKRAMLAERLSGASSASVVPAAKLSNQPPVAPLVQSVEPSSASACRAFSPWVVARLPAPLSSGMVSSVIYLPDAVSAGHEAALLEAVQGAPWVTLRHRRLQQWGGLPGAGGLTSAAQLPPFLKSLADGLVSCGLFSALTPPNHVLVNAYEPGEGIDAHTDGPCYAPVVATLSLGDDAVMRYRGREPGAPLIGELVLRKRSLVITQGALYEQFAHEIDRDISTIVGKGAETWNSEAAGAEINDVIHRQSTRISITLRHAWTRPI